MRFASLWSETNNFCRAECGIASLGFTDEPQVDMLGLRYKSVNIGGGKSRAHLIGESKM